MPDDRETMEALAVRCEEAGGEFVLKRWDVEVSGYGSAVQCAKTRGRALADAWRCDAFSNWTFGQFLKRARCTRSRYVPDRWGDPITIEGRPAFFVDSNQQYVQFAYPGKDVVLNAHPYDVEPEHYRPSSYRSARTLTPRPTEGET